MLSAIIITKNEQNNIKQCLESIKGIVDEIILVDSYSSDKTIEIAKRYTNNIFLKKFENDFSAQRNFALTKAKGDWILSIDADETLSKPLKKVIPKLIKNKNYLGYLIPRRNYINNKKWLEYGLFYPDYQLRLFKKNEIKFNNKADEYPNVDSNCIKKILPYLIHNATRTKYDMFSSILKARKYIEIKSDDWLVENKPLIYYPFRGIFLFTKYFINSFLLGKGYKDGYNGFRASVIFASFPLLISLLAVQKRIKKSKITKC